MKRLLLVVVISFAGTLLSAQAATGSTDSLRTSLCLLVAQPALFDGLQVTIRAHLFANRERGWTLIDDRCNASLRFASPASLSVQSEYSQLIVRKNAEYQDFLSRMKEVCNGEDLLCDYDYLDAEFSGVYLSARDVKRPWGPVGGYSVTHEPAQLVVTSVAGAMLHDDPNPLLHKSSLAGALPEVVPESSAPVSGPPKAAKGAKQAKSSALLKQSYRFERAHWIYVHLEGTPAEIGYQHGWWLAPEIEDALAEYKLNATHSTKREWGFFRDTARDVQWPHIEAEYREELEGISRGLIARGYQIDVWDVVALNAMEEIPDYYVPWLDKKEKRAGAPHLVAPGNCSAFVATGTWTKDHKPVIAHNNWSSIMAGERWRIIFDITPTHGQRMLMDGFPGLIASDDDFGINAARLAVTETTITGFYAFDPDGAPEFVRARKALQYATSIDEYIAIMLKDNNGGYANDWLLADYKTGEIAQFEIGLKKHRVWRTKDGYFAGSNFASDPELIKEETTFDTEKPGTSPNARHKRWDELLTENKGKIDAALAQTFLADHHDAYDPADGKNERTLCGHVNLSPRGVPEWESPPYNPDGAVNAKAMDSNLASRMSMVARTGFPCGEDFLAEQFLKAHPEFEWQRPVLRDMKGNPWAEFRMGDKR